jgi:glutamyl-tRNA synthetase
MRLRFAPSPTGTLHLGNARTALFNFLAARREGGTFVIRIEDTDRVRSDPRHEAALLADLAWLGLDWQEGPDRGGDFAPYRQSERQAFYADALNRLRELDCVYPCFCTDEELARDQAEQRRRRQNPRYVGRCARLAPVESARRLRAGEPAAWRWRVPPLGSLGWNDLVYGPQHQEMVNLGDFVVCRRDGQAGFLLSNIVDDCAMRITHVLRGADHLSNTGRQLLMARALALTPPAYGHLPLLVNRGGTPLAKRTGATGLGALAEAGYLPGAVRNYLARLGHVYAQDELLDLETLAGGFDWTAINRSSAILDPIQLDHWQHLALRALDDAAYDRWASQALGPEAPPGLPALVRDNVRNHADLVEWRERLAGRRLPSAAAQETLRVLDARLREYGVVHAGEGTLADFLAGLRTHHPSAFPSRQVYPALRAILTGSLEGPELARIWDWLGPERRRLAFRSIRAAPVPPAPPEAVPPGCPSGQPSG